MKQLFAIGMAAVLIGCGGLTPAEDEQPPVERPERVEVSLHVDRPDESPEQAAAQFSRASASDDAGSGGIHSSVSTVQEGESFRLMVRFSGTTPINGTCTITMVDTGGHVMADATAEANGFDASTDLIATVDDDKVTTSRSITATLASCDLGEVEYTIGEPNSVAVSVRDHDPDTGTQTVPEGVPIGITPLEREPEEPEWVPRTHTASIGSGSAVWERYLFGGHEFKTVRVSATVSFSPSLPSLPVSEEEGHTGQYIVQVGWTIVKSDGTKRYGSGGGGLSSGSSVGVHTDEYLPDGGEVRVSLDAFAELYYTGGNNNYINVAHYGTYVIGSSSASVTVPPMPCHWRDEGDEKRCELEPEPAPNTEANLSTVRSAQEGTSFLVSVGFTGEQPAYGGCTIAYSDSNGQSGTAEAAVSDGASATINASGHTMAVAIKSCSLQTSEREDINVAIGSGTITVDITSAGG